MAEEEWYEEQSAAPRKGKVPGWLWFCGGGCLLTVLFGIAAAVVLGTWIMEGFDPNRQWDHLAEALPYEGRPEHLRMTFGWQFGRVVYVLRDDRGYTLLVNDLEPSQVGDIDMIFSEEFEGQSSFGFGGVEEAELGVVNVQGLDLPVQRFYQSGGSASGELGQPEIASGQSAFVKAPPADGEGELLLMIIRTKNVGESITDDEIRQILEPFQIGPEYVTPEAFGPDTQEGMGYELMPELQPEATDGDPEGPDADGAEPEAVESESDDGGDRE